MERKIIAAILVLLIFVNQLSVLDIYADTEEEYASSTDSSETVGFCNEIIYNYNDEKTEDRIHYLRCNDGTTNSNDAIIIESNGHFGLIDASRRLSSGVFDSRNIEGSGVAVRRYLEALGADHLDFIIGTHSHMDHMGGIPHIVEPTETYQIEWDTVEATPSEAFDINKIIELESNNICLVDENTTYIYKSYTDNPSENSVFWENGRYYTEAEDSLTKANKLLVNKHSEGMNLLNAEYHMNGPSDIDDSISFKFGDYNISLYNLYSVSSTDENANSIVTYVEKNGIKTVMTADIDVNNKLEQKLANAIVDQHGKVDVMKVPHHGWIKSTSKEFVDKLSAKYAIISTNYTDETWYSPFYGYMKLKGMNVYRTLDVVGNSIVQDMTNGLNIETGTIEKISERIPIKSYRYVEKNDRYSFDINNTIYQTYCVNYSKSVQEWKPQGTYRWTKWWKDWDHYDLVCVGSGGLLRTGWNTINGKMYYFGDDGILKTGWQKKDGKLVYLRKSGSEGGTLGTPLIGWQLISNQWYYFDSEGIGYTGMIQYGAKTYYVDNGKMVTGWVEYHNKRYFFDEDGMFMSGWKNINGTWYYFDSSTQRASNEWIDGFWINENGACTYAGKGSWKRNNNGWWFEDTKGWYPKNQWQIIDKKWYCFKSNGYMASNEWVNGYWLSSNGSWVYSGKGSWKKNSNGWWYEDTKGWYPTTQWQKIDNKWYYFDAEGYMVTNQEIDGWRLGVDGALQDE